MGGTEVLLQNMPRALPLHTTTNLKDWGDLVYMATLFYSFIIWPLPTATVSELRAMLGQHWATTASLALVKWVTKTYSKKNEWSLLASLPCDWHKHCASHKVIRMEATDRGWLIGVGTFSLLMPTWVPELHLNAVPTSLIVLHPTVFCEITAPFLLPAVL